MKKRVYVFIVLLLFYSFFLVMYNSGSKTIQEALSTSHPERIDIIHEENTKHGIIVFYHQLSNNDFSVAVVKKRFGNFKVIYSGAQGDIDLTLNRFGFTHMFFPSIGKESSPMYFGLIRNPEIAQIKIIEKKRNIEGQAKIIAGRGARVWLMDMKGFEGTDFQIIALSKDNKEIAKRDDTISGQVSDTDHKPITGE
ncbi:hypothetical protein [Paenibacillus thiaminolyticus]|uniref:Uncharacterized protein n=1 Tax=Paenibacillus thiaminolyticus TaxID=49283 RepID=A0A3A3H936_PANTH|nr:hypothetical protein [Paenibacillus thiaminolyticus]RJG26757.1 hypothetical protein DQX05_01640 [Paenibacillus thiaminolyticus]